MVIIKVSKFGSWTCSTTTYEISKQQHQQTSGATYNTDMDLSWYGGHR